MKTTQNVILSAAKNLLLVAVCILALSSCEKWTQTENVAFKSIHPWESNPELWGRYFDALKTYKAGSNHFRTCVFFDNDPEGAPDESAYLRSLPDSLDMVILTNAANFSANDAEDMEWMNMVGTKVLYGIDLDETDDLNSVLKKATETVKANALGGYALKGTFKLDDTDQASKASTAVSTLSSALLDGQQLAFFGDPRFIAEADRNKIDWYILDTRSAANVLDVFFQIKSATDIAGIEKEKLLLCACRGGVIIDESNKKVDAVETLEDKVLSYGPLGGFAMDEIAGDYYHAAGNYLEVRSAIHRLNP